MALRLVYKQPVTPPYCLLLFYTVYAAAALLDLAADVLTYHSINLVAVLVDALRLVVPTVSLWIGGTFPMERILPAPNVAGEKDVRLSSACSNTFHIYVAPWIGSV